MPIKIKLLWADLIEKNNQYTSNMNYVKRQLTEDETFMDVIRADRD